MKIQSVSGQAVAELIGLQMNNWPNKALEPTRMLVTSRAYARAAPSTRAAQL